MNLLIVVDSFTNFLRFLSLLVIFVFVLFVCYATTRYIASFQKGKMGASNIKLLDAARLTQSKYLQIVEIGDKYFVLAICKDTVTKVGEFSKDELTLADTDKLASFDFKTIFDRIKKKDSVEDNESSK